MAVSKSQRVKAVARERIGSPKPSLVIPDKTKRKKTKTQETRTGVMNKNLTRLIKRLRSGKYKQAKKALRIGPLTDRCLCVEGLMCEMFRQDTGKGEWISRDWHGDYLFSLRGNSLADAYETAPPEVYDHFGLPVPEECTSRAYDGVYELNQLNDKGYSFPKIADVLEEVGKNQ